MINVKGRVNHTDREKCGNESFFDNLEKTITVRFGKEDYCKKQNGNNGSENNYLNFR